MTYKKKESEIVNLVDNLDDIIEKLEKLTRNPRLSDGIPTEAETFDLLLKAYAIKASLLLSDNLLLLGARK